MTEQELMQKEEQLREQADRIQGKSFDDKMNEISSRLETRTNPANNKIRPNRLRTTITAIAVGFVFLFGIGIFAYLAVDRERNQGNPPATSYDDENIVVIDSDESEILGLEIYQPKLNILTDERYKVGKHKVSNESVYYIASGKYTANAVVSSAEMRIILQSKYFPADDADYNTTDTLNINGKVISHFEISLENSVYLYKLGFTNNGFRYYIEYRTTEKDGYVSFLQNFIQ